MADETPKKARKTTTRAPRKRANDQTTAEAAPRDGQSTEVADRNLESPLLAIEQSSEVDGRGSNDLDEIRRQAYALYLSRGGSHGEDVTDWLEAERIVRLRRNGGSTEVDASERGQP